MAETLGEQLFPDFGHTLGTLILEKSESGTALGRWNVSRSLRCSEPLR